MGNKATPSTSTEDEKLTFAEQVSYNVQQYSGFVLAVLACAVLLNLVPLDTYFGIDRSWNALICVLLATLGGMLHECRPYNRPALIDQAIQAKKRSTQEQEAAKKTK